LFLVYIDDSGDEHHRCFSALIIHESVWREVRGRIRDFRRDLKTSDAIFITKELHATDFVAGRGRISLEIVTKARRCEIFRETLRFIATLPKIQLINGFSTRAHEYEVFERMMNRVNRTMAEWKSHALIICDEGKDYTGLVRRMSIYNPIASQYGVWPDGSKTRNIPTDRLVEDPVFRNSKQSVFIQLADFAAYALFRSEVPLASKAKYGLDLAFQELHPICLRAAFAKDPRQLGIIRYP
jgi:hypothetical protein